MLKQCNCPWCCYQRTQLRSALKASQEIKAAEDSARKAATAAIAKADKLMGKQLLTSRFSYIKELQTLESSRHMPGSCLAAHSDDQEGIQYNQ